MVNDNYVPLCLIINSCWINSTLSGISVSPLCHQTHPSHETVSLASQPTEWDQLLFVEVRSGFLFPTALIDYFPRYYMGKKRSLQNGDIGFSDSVWLLLFFLIKISLSWRNFLLVKIAACCYQREF